MHIGIVSAARFSCHCRQFSRLSPKEEYMLLRMSLVVAAIASLSMVGQSRAQELLGSEHVLPIVEMRNAGTFELQPDGSLRRVLTPISDEDVVWFESMNSALSFFHIGEMQDPPSGIPMSESVSHGDGLSTEGGTVCGFTMTYATSQRTGSLDVIVTYYDDGDAGETPSPVAAAFLISDLPKPEPDDPVGAFGFVVTVTLPESLHFNISTDEFQYGIRMSSGNGLFGPTLQVNIPGQTAGGSDTTVNATVGRTWNFFESWFAPGQNGGVRNGNFWFGATGPWSANAHRVYTTAAAPSASIDAAYVIHNAIAPPNNVDTCKVVHKEGTGAPAQLTYDSLINSAQGINGIGFDVTGLSGTPTAADFVCEESTDGSTWTAAASPTVSVVAGTPSQVVLTWADGTNVNRWLRITAKDTLGIPADEVYYIGHLLGEAGPTAATYSITFGDITPVRAAVGSSENACSTVDIDKSGLVTFADITAVRGNVGATLPNISVP